jgi:membrane-associated phospholipid phosphatase
VKVYPNADSFPSGHVFGEVLAYGLIFEFIPRIISQWHIVWLTRMFCVFVVVVGAPGRLYYGGHWASDVLGSALLALMFLIPALWIDGILERRREERLRATSTPATITAFPSRASASDVPDEVLTGAPR